jgi:hypothetical protein
MQVAGIGPPHVAEAYESDLMSSEVSFHAWLSKQHFLHPRKSLAAIFTPARVFQDRGQ